MTDCHAYLPIRPRPIPGELASGYLVRVASANGYDSARQLCLALAMHGASLRAALRLQRADWATLFGPFPHYCHPTRPLSGGLRISDFNHHFMRWCPACLAESEHLRGEWGLKLYCVCDSHSAMLRDRCPQCQAVQRIERARLSVCTCGYNLAQSPCESATLSLLGLHQVLRTGLFGVGSQYNAIGPSIWLRLVKYLGPFDADPLAARPGQVKNLHQLPVAIALANGAANLLMEWPLNFDRLLVRIRAAAPSVTHIADAFGSLYRVLYRDLNAPALAFLRKEFEAYLHENWFGLLGRRNRRLQSETVAAHPQRATMEIAQAAKTSAAAVRHLADAGVIRGRAIRHASGRTTWVIPQAEASNVEACRLDSLTLRRAAQLLGLERSRVRELIDASLLHAWINPGLTGAATWWLSKKDTLQLAGLAQAAGQIRWSRGACVALATVLKTWRLRDGEFPALIRALVAGEFPAARRADSRQGLGNIGLGVDTLRAWLDGHRAREQSWMSVATAASWLGLKQQVAYELVARGLLVVEIQDGTRRVHRDAALAFRSSYVSLAEIAAIYKRTPRYMLARLVGKPVCGPTVDGARQYFYKRDEIGSLRAV